MSGSERYSDTGQEVSQDGLHLREIRIDFLQQRPRDQLILIVRLNDKKYETNINRGDEVRWSGNIYCPLPSSVQVEIRRNNPFILPGNSLIPIRYASIQAPLSLGLSSLSDVAGRINVTFTISESTVSSRAEATQEQLRMKRKMTIIQHLEEIGLAVKLVRSTVRQTPGDDMHPAADSGIRLVAFQSLIEACEHQEFCSDKALDLVREFEPFLLVTGRVEELRQREETRYAVEVMLGLVERTSQYILNHISSGVTGDQFGEEYESTLGDLKINFTRAKQAFSHSVELVVFKALAGVERNMQFSMLHGKLSDCEHAHFRSGKDSSCLEGTRVELLGRIMDGFIQDISAQAKIFCLRGKAGSGKSTVANTVAQAVQDRGYLLSCFCCKRDDATLSDPRRVLPTLAFRFAQHHESYRASIFPLVHTDTRGTGIATTADIDTQFEKLFKSPLTQTVDPLRPHVVVIDALDECGSSKEQASLAKCFLALSRLAPWIKVFVTSRDEPAIRKVFTEDVCVQCNINEEKGTDEDIRQYLESQARGLEFTLSSSDAGRLVRRAEGLFIWCSTLFKFLEKCHNPRKDLDSFLRGEEQEDSLGTLYSLYDRVLESAAETKKDVSFMRAFLAIVAVVAGTRPLSAKAIAWVLQENGRYKECREEDVERVVAKLHAVLYVEEGVHGAIRAYHTSFYDFLQHKATEDASGWEGLEVTHCRMFRRCMHILNVQLRFNVCGIETPVLNKDIPDLPERIAKRMSEELQYSSRFWFIHLSSSNLAQSDGAPSVCELLCSRKLLFWLESLSLQSSLSQSLLAFAVCMSFFKEFPAIVAAASDAHRFVTSFFEAMDSIPHIYLSSLFWLPQDSLTYRNLELSGLTHLQLIENKRNRWDAVIWERSIGPRLGCVAHSPDGRYVACGADDGRIYILDAHTGAREGEPLHGHSNAVSCLAYSPNGQFIASGSRDYTIRIWDANSGEAVFDALVGHTDWVTCLAWSPGRQSLASCSCDGTIRVWNTQTGTLEGRPLRSCDAPRSVHAVAFPPDGARIASDGGDGTIRIWGADTHEEVRQPLRVRSSHVQSLRYSPDGGIIIESGMGKHTIHVWNAETGEAIGQPLQGHTSVVYSVMFSSNGQFIVSGSWDRTVRVWDAESGAPVGEPLRGHTGSIMSISCSPDGLSIASASEDGTIRVWEMPTGSRAQEQPQGHDGPVEAVAFSPDSQHIVTGSEDFSVRLWDAWNGAPIGKPLLGHKSNVSSVMYAPDGQSVVSGSSDCTVRVWNTKTGEAIGEPLRGHRSRVVSVAYSPNGCLIASASWDGTVRLWDAQTRRAIGGSLQAGAPVFSMAFSPDSCSLACGTEDKTVLVWDIASTRSLRMTLRGHSGRVLSVAFSPDSDYIASGSWDKTVRIWDARTGEPQGSPLQCTGGVQCVAISPNNRLIASCSQDGVRLWDVQTRLAIGDTLRGHTSWVLSVAFSPNGRSLVSAGHDWRSYVYTVPSIHPFQAPGGGESLVLAHWLECCSRMDQQDGWIKDGNNLLLWTPLASRTALASRARTVISRSALRVTTLSVDYETLFRYSGTAWVNILSDISSN